MVFGQGEHTYELHEGWGKHFYSPFVEVTGIGVDSKDQIYAFIRGIDPVLVFDSQGNFLRSWGRDAFTWPHGLYVGPDDSIYCTDGDHTVRKFNSRGRLLMTLGKKDQPSDTGADSGDYRTRARAFLTVKRASGPFNCPTDVTTDSEGNLYVSDGYGNARIHKFSKDGDLLLSWGEPGVGPGQFNLPHGIAVDREGIVYLADRENSRIQLFNDEGKFLKQWNTDRPQDIFLHDDNLYIIGAGGLSICTREGQVLSSWGKKGCEPGSFFAAHDLCVDSKGDIYIGEVVITAVGAGPRMRPVPANCHTLQKFQRVR